MEPIICPPWWPDLLWWLLHHPHRPEPPPEEILRELQKPVEAILAALTIYVQAQTTFGAKREELRGEMQHEALQQIHGAVELLGKMSKAEEQVAGG